MNRKIKKEEQIKFAIVNINSNDYNCLFDNLIPTYKKDKVEIVDVSAFGELRLIVKLKIIEKLKVIKSKEENHIFSDKIKEFNWRKTDFDSYLKKIRRWDCPCIVEDEKGNVCRVESQHITCHSFRWEKVFIDFLDRSNESVVKESTLFDKTSVWIKENSADFI